MPGCARGIRGDSLSPGGFGGRAGLAIIGRRAVLLRGRAMTEAVLDDVAELPDVDGYDDIDFVEVDGDIELIGLDD